MARVAQAVQVALVLAMELEATEEAKAATEVVLEAVLVVASEATAAKEGKEAREAMVWVEVSNKPHSLDRLWQGTGCHEDCTEVQGLLWMYYLWPLSSIAYIYLDGAFRSIPCILSKRQ